MKGISTQIQKYSDLFESCKKHAVAVLSFSLLLIITPLFGLSQSSIYTTPGTDNFTVPANVTAIRIETWGGGGAGGGVGSVAGASGGGGGGGAYARSILTVIPGDSYPLSVGAGGIGVIDSAGRHGDSSWFGSPTTVLATGGTGGFPNALKGLGGTAALSIGIIKYSGADGDAGWAEAIPNGGYGGGGGSSAGISSAGNSPLAATPWLGGIAPAGGGSGGSGPITAGNTPRTGNGNSAPGVGGGGGGAKKASATGPGSYYAGGNGHDGQVIVSWPAITSLSSASGCEGTTITINGTNLSGATAVTIGGMPAVVVSSTSTQITATIGGGPGGTVTVTTDYGTVTGTDNFIIYPKPAATIVSGGGSFCESAVITAENGGSGTIYYQGITPNGTSTADPSTAKTITVSGTYYFRALSSNNCWGDEGNAIVVINPNPTADAGPALSPICQGASTPALGGSFGGGATGATWDDGGAGGTFTNNDGSNPGIVTYTAAASAPASVTLTLTTVGGSCGITSVSKTLTVHPLVTGSISGDAFVCRDATAPVITFTASDNGTAPYTFGYKINGGPTQTITTASGNSVTLTVPMATPGSFTYSLVSVQDAGSSPCTQLQATSATVVIKEPVAINEQPTPVTICVSYPVSFSVIASGDSLHYQWYKDGAPLSDDADITGSQASQLDIDQVQTSDMGSYYVIISGSSACSAVQSVSVLLKVTEEIAITQQPVAIGVCEGGTAVFSVAASGTGINYKWQKNNVGLDNGPNISGVGTPVLTITNVSAADAANYRVRLTSEGFCSQVFSKDVKLTVNPIPSVNAVDTQIVCSGYLYAGLNFSGSVPGTVYKWTNDDPSIGLAASGTGPIPPFMALNTGSTPVYAHIKVTPEYTNAGATCTGDTIEVVLAVNVGATVDAVSDQVICNAGTSSLVHFTSQTVGGTVVFNWENNNSSIGLTGGGTGDIPSFTAINTGTTPVTATIKVTPVYTNVLSTCEGIPSVFTIIVNPTATVNAVADQVVCSGTTIPTINFSSTASGGTVIYNWTNSDPSIGLPASGSGGIPSFMATNNTASTITAIIKVKATFTNGAVDCEGPEQTFQVIVYPAVTLTANPPAPEICSESTTNISLTSNAGGADFSWTVLSQTDVTGATGGSGPAIQQVLTATGTDNGTVIYTVNAMANDCPAPPVTITVTVKPQATVTPLTQSICNGSTIDPITLAALPAGTITSWTRDNPPGISSSIAMSGSSGPVSGTFTNSNTAATPVNFMVTAQAGNGCMVTKPVMVTVFADVNPVTVSSSQIVCEGKSTAPLTSTAPTGGSDMGYSYQWQSADTTTGPWIAIPGATNANYKPPTAPKYYRLVVTNSCDTDTSNWVQIETDEAIGDTRKGHEIPLSLCDDQNFHYHVETVGPRNTTRYIRYSWSSPDPDYFTSDTTNPFGTETDALLTTRYFADLDFMVHNKSNVSREGSFILTPVIYNPNGTVHCALDPVINKMIIDPIPVIGSATASACSGTAFSVTPANGNPVSNVVPPDTKYSWDVPSVTGGLTGGSAQTAQATISQVLTNPTSTVQTATYTVTPLTDSGCGGNSFTVEVKVNPRPVIDTQYLTVCTGVAFSYAPPNNEPVTIVPAGTTYSWLAPTGTGFTGGLSGNGSTITGTLSTINPTPVKATYKVTPKAGAAVGGCTGNEFYLVVTINPKATASFHTDQTTVCYNGSANIIFSGSPNTIVSYTVNGTPATVTLDNLGNYPLNTGALTANTIYTLTGIKYPSPGAECAQPLSGSINITVNPLATATVSLFPSSICIGQTSTLTFSGNVANTIVTYNDGTADQTITLGNDGEATVVVSPATDATYTLVNIAYPGALPCVQPLTGSISIDVDEGANAGIINSVNDPLCIDSPVMLTTTGDANGVWSSSNAAVATINAAGILTPHSAGTADIKYTVNAGCNAPVDTFISITVNPNATAGVIDGKSPLCVNGAQYQFSTTGDAGGQWFSSNTAVATIDAATGIVTTGSNPGQTTISYRVTAGCNASPGSPVTASLPLEVVDASSVSSGSIDGPITICANADGLVYSISPVINASAYAWVVPTGWSITSGDNTNSITVQAGISGGNVQVNAGNTCGYGPASNLPVTVLPKAQWFGYNPNWNDPVNWCGGVPDGTTDVVIPATGPASPYYMPQLTADGAARNLDIAANMRLDLNGYVFTLNGALSGTGTFTGSQTSGLIIGGNAGILRFTPGAFNNYLKVFTINSGGSVALGNALNIAGGTYASSGVLTANGPLMTNDNLILKSDANGDARIGISSAVITGNVAVERFIPAQGQGAWRFLSVPFDQTAQSINAAWQEGVTITTQSGGCPVGDLTPAGLGTQITGIGNVPGSGYDFHSTDNPSIRYWGGTGWQTPPSSLTAKLTDHYGWYTFVRGDRKICLWNGPQPANATTLRATGTLNQKGGINTVFNSFSGGVAGQWFMAGNPYASPVNLTEVINSRANGFDPDKIWVMDPKIGGNNGVGGYVTYSNGVWTPSGGSYPAGNDNLPIIQSGQGFMVATSAASGQVQFAEADKTSTEWNVFGLRARSINKLFPVIYCNLMSRDTASILDGVAAGFSSVFSAQADSKDAFKLWNENENLAIVHNEHAFAIDFRPLNALSDTIFYRLYLRQQPYVLQFFATNIQAGNLPVKAWLVDRYAGIKTEVKLADTTFYSFTPNVDTNSYRNRFMLVFKHNAPAPVAATNKIKASIYPNPLTGKAVNIVLQNAYKGEYEIAVYNSTGDKLESSIIYHSGQDHTYKITGNPNWINGLYHVNIINKKSGERIVLKLIINK